MTYFKLKILIPCVAATSMIRQKMYDAKILWLIGIISELRIGLIFQYTQLHLRSFCTKYICILNTILTTHVQKRLTFQKMSICGSRNVIFSYFSWFFTVRSTNFYQILQDLILRYKLWTINSFCTQNVSLYWFCVKLLWFKGYFLLCRDFLNFGVFKIQGAAVKRLEFCVYLYLEHDSLHPYESFAPFLHQWEQWKQWKHLFLSVPWHVMEYWPPQQKYPPPPKQ